MELIFRKSWNFSAAATSMRSFGPGTREHRRFDATVDREMDARCRSLSLGEPPSRARESLGEPPSRARARVETIEEFPFMPCEGQIGFARR
jgi:hypothetical protein